MVTLRQRRVPTSGVAGTTAAPVLGEILNPLYQVHPPRHLPSPVISISTAFSEPLLALLPTSLFFTPLS